MKSWFGSGVCSVLIHVVILIIFFFGGDKNRGTESRTYESMPDEIGLIFIKSNQYGSQSSSLEDIPYKELSLFQDSERVQNASTVDQADNAKIKQLLPLNTVGSTARLGIDWTTLSGIDKRGNRSIANNDVRKQTAGFSGIRGVGNSFVYVIDRSESMNWNGGGAMYQAINDVIVSIDSLDPCLGAFKFQLVVFNQEIEFFENNSTLIDVTERNKSRVIKYLRSLVAYGGTEPEQALLQSLKLRPDVVFFLTDADEELTQQALFLIKKFRIQYLVKQICVVEFGKASATVKKSFRQLAEDNNGTYVFKKIDEF